MLNEGKARRDQNCHLFEKDHRRDVKDYRDTVGYLKTLTVAERSEGINAAILMNLPKTRAEVRADVPPAYCNEPGVGLSEFDEPKPPHDPFLKSP